MTYDFDNKKDDIKAFYQVILDTIPERHYVVRAQYGVPRKIPIFKIFIDLIADANARLKKALNRNQIC
jgi:hypothetical protein